jgi:hypothetical protein
MSGLDEWAPSVAAVLLLFALPILLTVIIRPPRDEG